MFEGLAQRLRSWLRPLTKVLSVRLGESLVCIGAVPPVSALGSPLPSAGTRTGAALSFEDLARIRADLQNMLGRHTFARRVLRHLACVEHSLIRVGAESFDSLPIAVIQLALNELEAFVDDWGPRGLAELRVRLSLAVIKRASTRNPEGHDALLSAFWVDSRMQVSDASLSAFDDAAKSWTVQAR